MSSSSSPEFEVFLSFRGSEIRKSFISHLSDALKRSGIRTFLDEEDLEKGDRITEAIARAIDGSVICIPVLSQYYADSTYCLTELSQMVNCNKKIIPIFYNVEPSDVEEQSGPYKAALERHRMQFDETTINEWKKALNKVTEFAGYDLRNTANGNEAKVVKMVVEIISRKLNHEPSQTSSDYPIDAQETESNAELEAIEKKLRQQKDRYLMDLEQHRKQREMDFKQKMSCSSPAERKNLQQHLDAFSKQIHQMKVQYLINHMAP